MSPADWVIVALMLLSLVACIQLREAREALSDERTRAQHWFETSNKWEKAAHEALDVATSASKAHQRTITDLESLTARHVGGHWN